MSIINTLNGFKAYIESGNPFRLQTCMDFYDSRSALLRQDFYTTKICQDEQIQGCVEEILRSLGVPPYLWGRYIGASITVYDFLLELKQLPLQKHEQIVHFISQIESKNKTLDRKIFFGSAFFVGLLWFLLPLLSEGGISILQGIVAATLFFPVVGILYTIGVGAYSFYQGLITPEIPLWKRFRDNFFLLAHSALNLAAYGILITAAATMTPVAACLFILAASVNIVKEAISLIEILIKFKNIENIDEHDDLISCQKKTRLIFEFRKRRNHVLVELGAAVVVAGIIAAWCFMPASLLISIGAILTIGLVYLAKNQIVHWNKQAISSAMEAQFNTLEQARIERNSDLSPEHSQQPFMSQNRVRDRQHSPQVGLSIFNASSKKKGEQEAVIEEAASTETMAFNV
ncbi:Uncharacterised protein [Legionella londiniensis]|uniref:Uncharacterized protein n=2 Tax=Legionella londiniensis TaxID=45068 RepID=A0A0W0VPK6_9GAMM|nr:hypothetical protein [Legionella londiniensis]KTD21853.1 hypothetical protein Llon_1018 [Legionella londiniensis]STX92664.1 Uncharacterised protein [Legionella londiniensis]